MISAEFAGLVAFSLIVLFVVRYVGFSDRTSIQLFLVVFCSGFLLIVLSSFFEVQHHA